MCHERACVRASVSVCNYKWCHILSVLLVSIRKIFTLTTSIIQSICGISVVSSWFTHSFLRVYVELLSLRVSLPFAHSCFFLFLIVYRMMVYNSLQFSHSLFNLYSVRLIVTILNFFTTDKTKKELRQKISHITHIRIECSNNNSNDDDDDDDDETRMLQLEMCIQVVLDSYK